MSWQTAASIALCFVAFAGLMLWLAVRFESVMVAGTTFFAAGAVGVYLAYFKRCPECRGRLKFRRDPIGATFYREIYCCERCQIVWDSGDIGDTRYED